MGLNITITDADQMNPPEIRLIAAALLVLAGDAPPAAATIQHVSVGYPVHIETRADSDAAWGAVNSDGKGGQICPDPLDHAVPPAPSSANVNPPPTAPGAIGTPPPPPASAPPAPTDANEMSHAQTGAAPGHPAPGVELDKNGLPWDERIHASTKVKNADDSWRLRRGVAPATVDEVVAELRARGYVQPGSVSVQIVGREAPPPPAAEQQSNVAPPPPAAGNAAPPPPNAPQQQVEPPPGAAPQPNVTIAPPATGTGVSPYIQLVKDVAGAIQAKRLTPEESSNAYQSLGLTGLDGFTKQPDLIDAYRTLLAGKL